MENLTPNLELKQLKKLAKFIVDEMDERYSADLANKWEGGTIMLIPGDSTTREHEIPIDKLLQKIVRVRDNLRVLEQQINTNESLSQGDKLKLQGYITKCYGSMTSFNFLFWDDEDKFRSKK
jgi:hypothetical protein